MNKVKKLPSSISIINQNHNKSTNSIQVTLYPKEINNILGDETRNESINETLDNAIVDSLIPIEIQDNSNSSKNPSNTCITPPKSPSFENKNKYPGEISQVTEM